MKYPKVSEIGQLRRNHHNPQQQYGISLLELLVAGCVIAVLAYFLLTNLHSMQKQAEYTAYEETRTALQNALKYEAMSRMARGESQNVPTLMRENPFDWLSHQPPHYLGIASQTTQLKPASWYFDPSQYTVLYVPAMGSQVLANNKPVGVLKLRVKLETGTGIPYLQPLTEYAWPS